MIIFKNVITLFSFSLYLSYIEVVETIGCLCLYSLKTQGREINHFVLLAYI